MPLASEAIEKNKCEISSWPRPIITARMKYMTIIKRKLASMTMENHFLVIFIAFDHIAL